MQSRVMWVLTSKWLTWACRMVLALVFIAAAVGKIPRPQEFADAVAAFRVLPIPVVNLFAIVLPWVELLCGIALLVRSTAPSASLLMLLMNLVFIAAAASAMARGLSVECGCFTLSQAHSKVGWTLLGRDTMLLLLCLPVLSMGQVAAIRSSAIRSFGEIEDPEAREDELLPV